jgi:hypothetical protein
LDIYIYIYRKYTRALTFENVGQIAVAIKHQEARARRGHTGHTGQSALLPSVKTPKDKNQDVSSSESSHAGSYLGVGGGNGGRRKLARASGYGRGEGGGGAGGWVPKISRDIQLLSEAGLRANRAVENAENGPLLPHIHRALSDQSGADEVAALEADAVMLRKLPAGSRAFVERQRRARALNAGDEPSPLRDLGRMYSMCT